MAASPSPGTEAGDPRSSGQGPGTGRRPGLRRAGRRRDRTGCRRGHPRLGPDDQPAGGLTGRDHRTIGKNCEIGSLATTTSHFLNRAVPTTPSVQTHRRDPFGHQGRQAARRASEHDPGLERRGTAALLPDQPAWRSSLPAGRSPALPGRRGDGRAGRHPDGPDRLVGRPAKRRPERHRPVRPVTADRARARPSRSARCRAPPARPDGRRVARPPDQRR